MLRMKETFGNCWCIPAFTGFEAKGLENGTQLFEELGNLIPDLILLDIMLPGDDGYTILEKIPSDAGST